MGASPPRRPIATPTSLDRAPPGPAPAHPDRLLGSVAAARHHRAGASHAAEAAQVAGAGDRHRGDGEVLGEQGDVLRAPGGRGDPLSLSLHRQLLSASPSSAPRTPHPAPRLAPPLLTRNVSATISAPRWLVHLERPTKNSRPAPRRPRGSRAGVGGVSWKQDPRWPGLPNPAPLCQAPGMGTQPHP